MNVDFEQGDLLILRGDEVLALLDGREGQVIDAVARAYELHTRGQSSLPHSTFLRFPDSPSDRIIALPAFLGGESALAGMKWVASFPGNLDRGLDRASALLALNSAATGRPSAVMEASIISARRTAASAALAAQRLMAGREVDRAGVIGCGLINFEVVRFLRSALPGIRRLVVFDLQPQWAEAFGERCRKAHGGLELEVAPDIGTVLASAPVISFATTAGEPHVENLSSCAPGSAILHVSLRDLSPAAILSADNVVDDLDHVCRARTSIHLTEMEVGHREFVRCNLGQILLGEAPARRDADSVAVFSPFGLGVLDLAVAALVRDLAVAAGAGTVIESFLPSRWTERES